jgi:hypothetical protein
MEDDHGEVRLPDRDRVRLRIFTLADHAAAPPDGKLYIGGAGVHSLPMPNVPGPIMAPLFLVVRLFVPYLATGDPHSLRIRILDEDAQPIGPDPVAEFADVETGRAPGTRPGDENVINLVVGLTGFPVERMFEREIRVRIHLDVDGNEMDTLPLKILRIPHPQGSPGGG